MDAICKERIIVNDFYVKSIIVTKKHIFRVNSYFDKTQPLADMLLEIAKDNMEKEEKNTAK